jgi:HSP20 family protein
VELPGVNPGDISIEVRDNTLIIQGEKKSEHTEENKKNGYYQTERTYGSFRRVIELPDDAAEEAISASNKDGVLKIAIPRKEKSAAESRKIEIV